MDTAEQEAATAQHRYSWRRFLRRGVYVAAIRVTGLACVFGLQIMLARLMVDTAEYGRYAWGLSLLFLVGAIAGLGLPLISARFVASLDACRCSDGAAAVIAHARRLLLRSAGGCALLTVPLLLLWRGDLAGGTYRDVTIAALLLTPVVTFAMLYRDIARARQWLGLAMLPLQVMRPLVTAVLAIGVWWLLDERLDGVTVLALAGFSLCLVLLPQALLFYRRQRSLPRENEPVPDEYRPERMLGTALPVFLTHCASMVITYSNVLLVGALAGPAAAGTYFAAERLAQLTEIPKGVVATINQQSMAAAHATGRTEDLQLLASQSVHGSLWPTLAVSAALIALAGPLLDLFGDDFTQARTVLAILVLSGIVNVFTGPARDLLVMTGRQGRLPRVMVVTALVHVAALCALVPTVGAVGAALASLLSSVLGQVWMMRLARRETGVNTTVLASLRRNRP